MLRFIWLLLLWLIIYPVKGQKVALVLSGGGAKGLAHVGVLKVLEENHVPIDYIVGTSMGGVIGGLYSAGYSAAEIEQLVLSQDFQNWVNGVIGENYNFYYSKKEDNASFFSLNISVDSSLNASLDQNLAKDMSLNFALAELLAQSSKKANYNFDSLFIPFRAIAADIFTQQQMVLKQGRLSQAIRATMSVPFFFRPIKIDDKYLFDGGIYNNFPVDVARNEFDPDIIIGVNVSSKIFHKYPYDQDDELIQQSLLSMLLDKPNVNLLSKDDIYLEPDIKDFSAISFKPVAELIDSGRVETKRHLPEIFKKISDRRDCDTLALDRINFVLDSQPLLFEKISLIGFRDSQKKYIKRLFKYDRDELNIYEIRSGYSKLISEEYFQNIYPGIVYRDSLKSFELELYGKPKPNLNIEFGGNIASRSISAIFFGVNYNHFNRFLFNHQFNFYTGKFYQSVKLASRINIPTKKQFYLEPSFIYNNWDYLNANEVLLDKRTPTIISQIDRKIGVTLGLPLATKNRLELFTSYYHNNDRFSNVDDFISSDTLDRLRVNGFRHGLLYSRNSLNRKQYPSAGTKLSAGVNYITTREKYKPGTTSEITGTQKQKHRWMKASFSAEQYFKAGWYRYGYSLESVISNQPLLTNYMATLINAPAYYPLNDSRTLFLKNFRARSYVAGGLRNIFVVNSNFDIRLEGYFFKPFKEFAEGQNQEPDFNDSFKKLYLASTLGAVYHSPLGPMSLSMNYYDEPGQRFGVLLHLGYLMFNQRSLE
ncbi:MAG: patatin-like phospholipase family protein [Cyclobacteriaceae bacterium]